MKTWQKALLLAAVCVFTYFDALSALAGTWQRDSTFYGFLVPLVSAYLIYSERHALRTIPVRPNILAGSALLVLSGAALLPGTRGSIVTVQQVSLLLLIPGLVLGLFGAGYARHLALPLSYLVFMFPALLDAVLDGISFPFQLFGALSAEGILQAAGIPVVRDAQYLRLPGITLEVARECSGTRYLLTIIATGIPLALFTQKSRARRVALVSLAVLVGILANPVRIALIGIWMYHGGRETHGPYHILQGLFVYAAGFLFLFAGAGVMARIFRPAAKGSMTERKSTVLHRFEPAEGRTAAAWGIVTSLLFSFGVLLVLRAPVPVPPALSLAQVPYTVGEWQGRDLSARGEPPEMYHADHVLDRIYRDATGRTVRLRIGYFESQEQNRELVGHKMGKLYARAQKIVLPLPGGEIPVNRTELQEDGENMLALYWYEINGRIIADNRKSKWITAAEGLLHGRTNGAIIIVSGSPAAAGGEEHLLKAELQFIREILPVLRVHLPQTGNTERSL